MSTSNHGDTAENAVEETSPSASGPTDTPPSEPETGTEATPATDSPELEVEASPGAGPEPEPEVPFEEAQASIEALLYASSDPLSLRDLKRAFPEAPDLVSPVLEKLVALYGEDGRGVQLVEVAGGWQITTRPAYHEVVGRLVASPKPQRLSLQALETLAVIAYRQPVTVPEIMELRGVNSAGVVRTLLERKLIKIAGRKNVVGRPLLYATTKEFLMRFGLKNLKDLPQLKDLSEVFGDDVAEQLEVLEALDQGAEAASAEPESSEGPAVDDASEPAPPTET